VISHRRRNVLGILFIASLATPALAAELAAPAGQETNPPQPLRVAELLPTASIKQNARFIDTTASLVLPGASDPSGKRPAPALSPRARPRSNLANRASVGPSLILGVHY
jgi:hypothetical protein